MKISCDIIRDILPLYAEEMVCPATKEFVDGHLCECEACKAELSGLRKLEKLPVEADVKSLKRVGDSIRRRRILAVLAVFLFLATVVLGGALMLDAQIFLSAEEAVKEITLEGDTVRIAWDNRVIGTGSRSGSEYGSNYGVSAWTNLQKILFPTKPVSYDELSEEVKEFFSREEYDSLDTTSFYYAEEGESMNFWYCDLSDGTMELILDRGMPHPDGALIQDGNRIRVYLILLTLLCVLCMGFGIRLRGKWMGALLARVGILAGSCGLSCLIVTAGQLADVYGRFTEMLVDSTAVAIPMTLCGMCVLQLVKLNRRDKCL